MVEKVIGIVGLGLMGGSFAKAVKGKCTGVLGSDICNDIVKRAIEDGTIDGELRSPEECDILIIALYPRAAVKYIEDNIGKIKKDLIITDLCGVKRSVYKKIAPICKQTGAYYIGGHPMAGKECWGYESADGDMFKKSSMLLTPTEEVPESQIEEMKTICGEAGFDRVVVTTPEEHDEIIAYTSQLAHIVSGAYMKSPTAERHDGFSAGSYRDLTRVAKLNENMWTELFLDNGENLSREIGLVIGYLEEYKKALDNGDAQELKKLVRDARVRKETIG